MLARELLESFAQNLANLENAYKAFDIDAKNYKGDPNKLKEIENLFYSFYQSISPAIKTLEMAEYRYQVLFKAARDAIFIINEDLGFVIDVNTEAENLTEKSREELIGLQSTQLNIFNDSKFDLKLLNTENSIIFREFRKSNGKMIFMEISASKIYIGDQHLIQLIFHDITEIKLAEQKLQKHAKNIEILNKIINVANQAKTLSDLMDNILNYIRGFLNLDGCCLYLVDKTSEVATIKASKGIIHSFIKKNSQLKVKQNPYSIVFGNGVAVFNNNFPEIIHTLLEGTDFNSIAVFPLFSKLEIIGAIVILLRENKPFETEEIDLFVSIGLEMGTSIERMKNEDYLRQSEIRNNFLLKYVPFSIFRISNKGIFLDIKLSSDFEKFILPEDLLGKTIYDFFPKESIEKIIHYIEEAIKNKESKMMQLNLSISDKKMMFQVHIDPIGNNEVLFFLQNTPRV
jgi:PAS domain S-box-containing protein